MDVLVNNAAIHLKKVAQEATDEDIEQIVNVNLVKFFLLPRVRSVDDQKKDGKYYFDSQVVF